MERDPWRNALRAESITVAVDGGTVDLQTFLGAIEGGGGEITWSDVTGKPATFPPAAHTHASTQITDATATGRSLMTASNADAARTAAGAAAADHTHSGLMSGSAAPVADATDEASAVVQLNALLGVLRARGVLSN